MVGILLLAGLAKLAEHTAKPRECAAVYGGIVLLFGLVFPSKGIGSVLVSAFAAFLGAWLLFSLLRRFQDSILLWIGALFIGILAMGAINRALKLTLLI